MHCLLLLKNLNKIKTLYIFTESKKRLNKLQISFVIFNIIIINQSIFTKKIKLLIV